MITITEIKKLARLVKLNFDHDQLADFQVQLSGIIDLIDQLSQADCSGVEPLTSVGDLAQRLAPDFSLGADISEELLSNVAGKSASLAKEIKCFIVPKVIEYDV